MIPTPLTRSPENEPPAPAPPAPALPTPPPTDGGFSSRVHYWVGLVVIVGVSIAAWVGLRLFFFR